MAEESLIELARRLQEICLRAGVSVATAESCTGGLVASCITDVSGSSGYFRGGVVSYSNEAKMSLLGVPAALLEAHGAVSAQVARAMAQGARERFQASLAVSVTGIAGPEGGTAAKPVGLTYLAVASEGGVEVRRYVWTGDRLANKEASARAALQLLLERVGALATPAAASAVADGEATEPAGSKP